MTSYANFKTGVVGVFGGGVSLASALLTFFQEISVIVGFFGAVCGALTAYWSFRRARRQYLDLISKPPPVSQNGPARSYESDIRLFE